MKKLIFLTHTAALLISTVLLLSNASYGKPSPVAGDAITEREVREYLAEMDRAVKALDVPAIMALLSGDVAITLMVPGQEGDERITFTKNEYEAYLVAIAPEVSGYVYTRRDTQITITPDGRAAAATYEIFEILTMAGTEVRSVTTERLALERRGGSLVATTLDAIVTDTKVDTRTDT